MLLLLVGCQRPGFAAFPVGPIVRVWVPRTIGPTGHTDINKGSLETLLRENSGHYREFHINTSAQQDAAIANTFTAANDKADFNLATNNCDEMAQHSYENAGSSAANYFGINPADTQGMLDSASQNPSSGISSVQSSGSNGPTKPY